MKDNPGEQYYNSEFVASSTETITLMLAMLTVGRVGLLGAALKYDRLLKVFFYYEALIDMLGHFIPQKAYADADVAILVWMLLTLVNFTLLYSDFKFCFPVSVMSLCTFLTGTTLVFAEEPNILLLVGKGIVLSWWLLISLLIIHVIAIAAGRDFISMQLAVEDNLNLIHNLDEGVVVLCDGDQEVDFSNQAALLLKINDDQSFHMNVLKKGGAEQDLDIDLEAFAAIETSLFKLQPPSLERTN